MAMFGLPHWQLKSTSTESGVVAPDERLPFAQTAIMGVQHAVAMFGATVLMPILMGVLIHLKYEKTGRTLDYSGSDGIRFGGACKPVAQILVVNQ